MNLVTEEQVEIEGAAGRLLVRVGREEEERERVGASDGLKRLGRRRAQGEVPR
jgi:hypothetical protein